MAPVVTLMILLQAGVVDPNRFNGFLILGYVVMALISVIYVVSLVTRYRNLREDAALLKRLLADEEDEN